MKFQIAPSLDAMAYFLDNRFNYPVISETFTLDDFEREYDSAFDILAEELSAVGTVTDRGRESDFSMSRYVDLDRAIIVVASTSDSTAPGALAAAYSALQRLPEEYLVCFDADSTYVCVRRDGTAIGYSIDGDSSTLRSFGFPVE